MESQRCRFCDKEMEAEASFCSACGNELRAGAQICAKCQQANPLPAHFCMACGDDLTVPENLAVTAEVGMDHPTPAGRVSWNPIGEDLDLPPQNDPKPPARRISRSLVVLGILVALLATAAGAYYQNSRQVAQRFLSSSTRLIGQLEESNQLLAEKLSSSINSQTGTSLAQVLPGEVQALQAAADEWSATKCPNQYLPQQENLQQLVQIQLDIMGQIPTILTHPLVEETDAVLSELGKNIADAGDLCTQLQLPGVTVAEYPHSSALTDKLSAYCAQQREIYKAKLARLETMQAYFQQMDSILQKNNEAKSGLGAMLDQIRSGEHEWTDYFAMIDGARSARANLRSQVNRLVTPAGTEEHSAELSRLLSLSIDYCDIMKAGATFESKGDYAAANKKYIEAQTLNDQIQNQYSAFNSKYQAGKTVLTNIENL